MTAVTRLQLDELNRMSVDDFVAALGGVFEHSAWVAEAVCAKRPFSDIGALHAAMTEAVLEAPPDIRLSLLRAHPELAGRQARLGELTPDSVAEQGSAGLDRLSASEVERFDALNRAYRDRFGFPFIIAVKDHDRASILASFEQRLNNAIDTEIDNALNQVFRITRIRLEQSVAT